jgi:hypothetical protein
MQVRHVAAALVCLFCTILTASCLQSPTTYPEDDPGEAQASKGVEPIGEAQQEAGGKAYESKDFPFVELLKDDGEGKGGGWQTADKTFSFLEANWFIPNYFWQCHIRIGMPIRSVKDGRVTPSRAALYSTEIANAVVDPLLDSRATWRNQGAVFCDELQDALQAMFKRRYPRVGARVSKP